MALDDTFVATPIPLPHLHHPPCGTSLRAILKGSGRGGALSSAGAAPALSLKAVCSRLPPLPLGGLFILDALWVSVAVLWCIAFRAKEEEAGPMLWVTGRKRVEALPLPCGARGNDRSERIQLSVN